MPIVKENNYWIDKWFDIGDVVQRTTRSSSSTSIVQRGQHVRIASYSIGATQNYKKIPSKDKYGNAQFDRVYEQLVRVEGSSQQYKSSHFQLVQGVVPVAALLESNRPVLIVKINEVVKDGKSVIEEVMPYIPVDSMSAARIYTANEITKAIRAREDYPKFRIYQEHSIAQAKTPEIEYK